MESFYFWIFIRLNISGIILIMTTHVCKVTVPFVHIRKFSYGPLNRVLYLYADLVPVITLSPTL